MRSPGGDPHPIFKHCSIGADQADLLQIHREVEYINICVTVIKIPRGSAVTQILSTTTEQSRSFRLVVINTTSVRTCNQGTLINAQIKSCPLYFLFLSVIMQRSD